MRAISSMATKRVLTALLEAAAEAGLGTVELESVGGVDAAQRVADGEAFDLVFLADDALARLAGTGHVTDESVAPVVVSQVAVGVSGVADQSTNLEPAYADADAFRQALLEATAIGYSTGPSGRRLLAMIEEWGLTDQIEPKLVQAPPGVPAASLVASGQADLCCQQLSELVGQDGVQVLGVLPDDAAIETIFSGAVATAASDADAAQGILDFLTSPAAADIKRKHDFGVPR